MPSASSEGAYGGPGTVTRNFLKLLAAPPVSVQLECLPYPMPERRWLHRIRQAAAIGQSLLAPVPAKPAFTLNGMFREEVLKRSRNADLVLLNGADLLWLLPVLPSGTPRALIAHNIEHRIFADECRELAGRFPLLTPLLRREAARLERWEIEGLRAMDRVLFLSAEDAALARKEGWVDRTLVVPPVFFDPPAARQTVDRSGETVEAGFLANLYWWPNRQGLQWFLDRVFPHVRDRVRLHLFGPGTERFKDDERIVGHGRIPGLSQAWACDVMLSPVLHGSGVSVKVAEAIYHGVPVLATRCSMRGFSLPADPCIAVLDQPEEWIDFLRSPRARELRHERIAPQVSEHFSGTNYVSMVREFLTEA